MLCTFVKPVLLKSRSTSKSSTLNPELTEDPEKLSHPLRVCIMCHIARTANKVHIRVFHQ